MATYKIYGKVNPSFLTTFAGTDTAEVPGTIQSTASSALRLVASTGSITLDSNTILSGNLTSTSGAGAIDFSPATGLFKTPTGSITLGPGNVTVSGNTSISASSFDGSSVTTFKIPTQFYIGATQTSSNVTATNLNTLTAGSNADALHTHSLSASSTATSGQTLWATPANGEVGYISGNNTWAKAKADSLTTVAVLGAYNGVSGTVVTHGEVSLLFVSGLTLSAGDPVYLSSATAGRVTNVAPTTTGHFEYVIGRVLDASGYDNINGSAQACIWDRKTPIQIG